MQRRNIARILSAVSLAALALGAALLAYMIPVEGEPGALPLALMLGGGVGCLVSVLRSRGPGA